MGDGGGWGEEEEEVDGEFEKGEELAAAKEHERGWCGMPPSLIGFDACRIPSRRLLA